LQRPAAAPFAKPIAVPPDGEHVAVVEQTIQDRGCHDRIAKYRAPLTDGRFEVTGIAPRLYRRLTSWNNRRAASGSNGR
jgi:hypothetical protein